MRSAKTADPSDRVAQAIDVLTRGAGRLEPGSEALAALRPPAFRRILVGVDGSEGARRALFWARDIAKLSPARVWTLSVAPPVGLVEHYLDFLGALGAVGPSDLTIEQSQRAEEHAAVAAETLAKGGIEATAEVAVGDPTQVLVERAEAHQADLVVVGSHAQGALGRLLLGGVAEGVKQRTTASVLVARGLPPPHRMLLPTDGSVASKRAAALGLALARVWNVPATLLHVLAPPPGVVGEEIKEQAKVAFGRSAMPDEPGVETLLELGPPADVIAGAAAWCGADLVVMGSRGLGGLRGVVAGSVSSAVSHRTNASVLLVKEPRRKGESRP